MMSEIFKVILLFFSTTPVALHFTDFSSKYCSQIFINQPNFPYQKKYIVVIYNLLFWCSELDLSDIK